MASELPLEENTKNVDPKISFNKSKPTVSFIVWEPLRDDEKTLCEHTLPRSYTTDANLFKNFEGHSLTPKGGKRL